MRILLGDCIDVMRTLPNESVDAIVTDPPYGLAFMGKEWDKATSPRAFERQAYAWGLEMERVLKPGGHLLAFGGTRTYHRLASGLEDAGFEIRDSIHWIYGSGFPKSLNLDGGLGTALKPAHEPIVLARKRLAGTVAATVAKFGTGALNVDGARVGTSGEEFRAPQSDPRNRVGAVAATAFVTQRDPEAMKAAQRASIERTASLGRWPPNLVLSHAPECVEGGKCAEDCPVAEMDRQSGDIHSAGYATDGEHCGGKAPSGGLIYHERGPHPAARYGDSGGASRFFPVFRYEAKPSRAEREAGLREAARSHEYGNIQDGRSESGEDYARGKVRNVHPTVKPIALMAWLCQLVTPKGGTVLDPFLGSGTTAIACQRLGLDCIGIEKEPEYVEIATARVRGDAPLFSEVRP